MVDAKRLRVRRAPALHAAETIGRELSTSTIASAASEQTHRARAGIVGFGGGPSNSRKRSSAGVASD
jgi:hypothetical protein